MEKLIEIARSFSYKVNTGDYQPKDFICSQKAECLESEAIRISEALHEFCKKAVMKSVNAYLKEQQPKPQMPTGRIPEQKLENELDALEEQNNKEPELPIIHENF